MPDYQSEKLKADMMRKAETDPLRQQYWTGYLRGLRRAEFGENFGTQEEHEKYLALTSEDDPGRFRLGLGYRDGLKFGNALCEN